MKIGGWKKMLTAIRKKETIGPWVVVGINMKDGVVAQEIATNLDILPAQYEAVGQLEKVTRILVEDSTGQVVWTKQL